MTTTPPTGGSAFVVLVPVKAWSRAKTRLSTTSLPVGLPAAFARDTVAAAAACPLVSAVYVVTDQHDFAPAGARLLPDEGEGDLNAALAAAAAHVVARHRGCGTAALLADVPCLRPDDLGVALRSGGGAAARWFVADAAGTGTTLLAAAAGTALSPAFGPDSARRHAASGALPVVAELASLRLDVDTPADLARARALGLGPHSSALLADADASGSAGTGGAGGAGD